MKRRDFLKAGSAGLAGTILGGTGLISWTPRAHAATISKTFYITDGFITQPDGVSVYFRGFSSSSNGLNAPGEHMIVQEGDTVRITVINTLGTSHSFVIDGMVDSGRISGGQSRTIQFTAGAPGSYLYYDGRNAPYNRLTGLHGGFAVMPQGSSNRVYSGSPTFVQQYFWVFNECDPAWNNAVRNRQTPSGRYTPRYFTINGLSGRPPGAPGAMDPAIDSMADPRTKLDGHLGDRTLIRCLNAGLAKHSVHTHGNHMEWLTSNGQVRPAVWEKDIVPLDGNGGGADVIYPFDPVPDAWPPMTNTTLRQAENEGRHSAYPMHLHDEMTQTAGGGSYMFGAMTDIYFHSR
ncbi:MAG: multicopper oxidase domain-containing protein [Proteobacteria bacterium]|jgi:FtsP/CotA-like multicopper oxidase with cupredoxin domain|nr:multicopper oxidase domain-containing protein [Pseudomonadota bacterium]